MDLINVAAHFWITFLLFLLFLTGTILGNTEKTKNTTSTKKNNQLYFKSMDSKETKTTTTEPVVFSTLLILTAPTATKARLSTLTTAKASSTKSIKHLLYEQNTRNYTTEHYKEAKKFQKNINTTADNSHEILKSYMTTTSGKTITSKLQDEHQKQTKLFSVLAIDLNNNQKQSNISAYNKSKILSLPKNTTNVVVAKKEMVSNLKLSNTQNTFVTTSTLDPYMNFNKDSQTFTGLLMPNSSNIKAFYISDPGVIEYNRNKKIHDNYEGSDNIANTPITETTTFNSYNKSYQATAVLTTTAAITRKPSHMYDNNSALSYLPYKSAALKASASVMKTLNNNLNIFSSSSSSSGSIRGSSRVSSSNLKRNTLLSLADIISTAKISAVDYNSTKNSSTINAQDTDDRTNVLKIENNTKRNKSLVFGSEAIKHTFKTTQKITPTVTTTVTNETSSSLLFNVAPPTHSVITTETTSSDVTYTGETTLTTTSTSKTTLKSTTRRRKIVATTLKPPPTIDDYQTITSQAGTHAYLPCNVKQLVKKPISWLRVRDGHILTVDQTTFIADQRFQSIFTVNPERWSLQIKYVQLKDAGIYECQVSTEPKASALVYLHVVEPKTELIGAPTRHVKAGSQVKLLCIISQALEPPLFINWFYNQKQIYLHNHKGWHTEIERIELPPETTTTTTTTSTTTTARASTTITTATLTLVPSTFLSSSSTSSTTSSAVLNGSETSGMHEFTSITTQQSLNNGNLLELVSESTSNNDSNFLQPEADFTSISLPTKQSQITTSTGMKIVASPETNITSISTTTMPAALPETTTRLSFDDVTDDEDDYKTNPTASTFDTAEAILTGRGYIMLSSLMTFTDVKQITTASLIIPSVQKQDSGNYTCSPSNSEPRTVILHVLNGEYSASAITSAALNLHIQIKNLLFNLSILTFIQSLLKSEVLYKQYIIKRYNGG